MASGAPSRLMFQCGSPGRSFSLIGPFAMVRALGPCSWLPPRPAVLAAASHAAAVTAVAAAAMPKNARREKCAYPEGSPMRSIMSRRCGHADSRADTFQPYDLFLTIPVLGRNGV